MGEGKQPGEALRSFAKVVLRAVVVGRMSCNLLSVELLTSLTVSDEKQTAEQRTTRQRPHPGSPTHLPAPGQEGFPGPLLLHNHLILKGPFLQHQIDCLLVNLNFTP